MKEVRAPLPPVLSDKKCKVPVQLLKNLLPDGVGVMCDPSDPSFLLELLDLTLPEWQSEGQEVSATIFSWSELHSHNKVPCAHLAGKQMCLGSESGDN